MLQESDKVLENMKTKKNYQKSKQQSKKSKKAPSLSRSELKKLPPAMSMEDRVLNALSSSQNDDWKRAREAREKAGNAPTTPEINDEDEPYTPFSDEEGDKTPVYASKDDTKTPEKAKDVGGLDFNIDTTKSFLETGISPLKDKFSLFQDKPEKEKPVEKLKPMGLKLKSMDKLMAGPLAPAEAKKELFSESIAEPVVESNAPKEKVPEPSPAPKSKKVSFSLLNKTLRLRSNASEAKI